MRNDEDLWRKLGLVKKYEYQGVALYTNTLGFLGKKDRVVITIEECYTNVRNGADVMAWAEEAMMNARLDHSEIGDEDYIVFVYVNHSEHMHHYKDKHIVCVSRGFVVDHSKSKRTKIFVQALKLHYKIHRDKVEHRKRRSPESIRYGYFALIPLIAFTVFCYF